MFIEYDNITYDVVDFYKASEDWMGYQLNYYLEDDPMEYSVGNIEIRRTSPTTCDVYWVDCTSANFDEYKLMSWSDDMEDGNWVTFGDWDEDEEEYEREYRALFIWMLIDACERFFN